VNAPSPAGPQGLSACAQPWIQAARPAAFPMIFFPLLIGQAFAYQAHGQLGTVLFLKTLLFGMFYQVYLLYTNDHADQNIDRTNTQYWLSGGSRVLPDGLLRSESLLAGARIALLALLGLALSLAILSDRLWMPLGTLLAVFLCWAYSRPPLQWSYRGHGEILQGIGCGVLLPLIGYYMQTGSLQQFPLGVLFPLYLLFYVSNIVTALPDYRSDRAGGKRTYPVRHGQRNARLTVVAVLALTCLGILLVAPRASWLQLVVIVAPACMILTTIITSGLLHRASVDNFPACKSFVTWVSASQVWLLCAWTGMIVIEGAR